MIPLTEHPREPVQNLMKTTPLMATEKKINGAVINVNMEARKNNTAAASASDVNIQ